MKKLISLSIPVFLSTTGAALAHPGEHVFSVVGSLHHLLTEPDHLAILAVVAMAVAMMFRWRRKRSDNAR